MRDYSLIREVGKIDLRGHSDNGASEPSEAAVVTTPGNQADVLDASQRTGDLVLIFDLGGACAGLFASDVIEILPMASLSGHGSEGSVLAGFLNLEGNAIPVLRTARLLNLSATPITLNTNIIVVRGNVGAWGLIVGRVNQLIATPRDAFTTMSTSGLVGSAIRLNGKIVPLISVKDMLLKAESERIAELRILHQSRLEAISKEVAACH